MPPPSPKQHRVLLFYMEWPLAKFRSYLAEVSREREVWSQSLALSSPNPPPYSLTFALVSLCTQSRMWSLALINIST